MDEKGLDTWQIHHRITLYLLDAIAPEALSGVATSGGRSVAEQFAHLHNIRCLWIETAASDLCVGVQKIPTKTKADKAAITKELLTQSLQASCQGISEVLRRSLTTGRVKGFKPHPDAFLGYIIAHESYHWGEVGIILTQAGTPLDKSTAYGLWEWGVR